MALGLLVAIYGAYLFFASPEKTYSSFMLENWYLVVICAVFGFSSNVLRTKHNNEKKV
jgi:hypothetical protein